MDEIGLLVPINYNGRWIKSIDGCWLYDGLSLSYVRVLSTTTYDELVDLIVGETGISLEHDKIEIHGWMSYPVKELLPPYLIVKDMHISTFFELNAKRDCGVPLCISTSTKAKSPSPEVKLQALQFVGDNSVNQPKEPQYPGLESDLCVDDYGVECDLEAHDSNNDDEECVDLFDYVNDYTYLFGDPFDYVNNYTEKEEAEGEVVDDELGNGKDLFDKYFGVYLESKCEEKNLDLEKLPSELHDNKGPDIEGISMDIPFASAPVPSVDKTTQSDGSGMGRGRPTWKRTSSDAQSTNINVIEYFKVGEIVKSKDDLILRVRVLSLKERHEFRVSHSDPKRFVVVCLDKECKWRLRGSFSKDHCGWYIYSYEKIHTCSIDLRHKMRRGSTTAEAIVHLTKNDTRSPIVIQQMLEHKYGVNISYWKAWRAKEVAEHLVRGSPEASFLGLPSYLWMLEQANPGTYTSYQVDENNCFETCFLAFGPSVSGFRTCIRPVIAVDACHLKGRYKGKLFLATAMDGNNQIYPLAFAVAATENDVTWEWFFKELQQVIGATDDLVIISDRHPSIEKCCMQVFPDAVYGICMFHLGLNMSSRFKVNAKEFLYGVAKAYTEHGFEERIHQVFVSKPKVFDYLKEADPKKWARCYFPARRYSIMTTNIAESMNSLLKEAREYPILGTLETIRTKMQCWFHDRLMFAQQCSTTLTTYAEKKLSKRDDKSRHFKAHPIDKWRFWMLDGKRDATVNIHDQSCTCMKFQLNQLPCAHAIRACRERGLSIYSVASRFYTNECLRMAYAMSLNPVQHRSEWGRLVHANIQSVVVNPPVIPKKKGRRNNKRILSQGEEILKNRCGHCREYGHNKKTCR